jgi:glycosyltransferase involved in cell wall biosynthesis
MRVSVIIPTYNSGPLVVEAVQSVLAQTLPAAEIIVVDDGSTDDTSARLARFGDRICYVRQTNSRVAAARNAGVALARGEALAFLDADDVWHPRKLERQVQTLRQHAEIGLLATHLSPWPGALPDDSAQVPGAIEDVPLARLLVFNPLATSSIIVRRDVLDRAGPFDTELFGPEDYDLWIRCTRLARSAVLRLPLTGYRDTTGSLSKQAETMRRGLLQIHAKLDAAGAWPNPWLRRKGRAHVDYSTGWMYFAAGQPTEAARLLWRSLATYPLPMSPIEMPYRCGRARLLARSAWRSCRGWLLEQRPAGAASTLPLRPQRS